MSDTKQMNEEDMQKILFSAASMAHLKSTLMILLDAAFTLRGAGQEGLSSRAEDLVEGVEKLLDDTVKHNEALLKEYGIEY